MEKIYNIFIIEENPAEIQLIKECLQILKCSNEITVAKNGYEVLNYLRKFSESQPVSLPDLFISDMTVPGSSAYEILTEIKKYDKLSNIPFVILTSSLYPEDIDLCYKFGASKIVYKHTDLNLLIEDLRGIIEVI